MEDTPLINNFLKIINNNKRNKNLNYIHHFKKLKLNNFIIFYHSDSDSSLFQNMNYYIYCDIKNYDVYNDNIIVVSVPEIFINENYRNKKLSYHLFYHLSLYLINKFKNYHVFIKLDDCTGQDYKNNIYAKLNFKCEQSYNSELIDIPEFLEINFCKNPSETRFAYCHELCNVYINKFINQ